MKGSSHRVLWSELASGHDLDGLQLGTSKKVAGNALFPRVTPRVQEEGTAQPPHAWDLSLQGHSGAGRVSGLPRLGP